MKVIVGLGNPGTRYERTRHNVGYRVVDLLHDRHGPGQRWQGRFHASTVQVPIDGRRCLLVEPTTYMNRSGLSVAEAARFFKIDPARDLLVIVDDIALPVGMIRCRASGGAGGHNGLADIERALGTGGYPRVRIGVGPKAPEMDQADYVLGRFTPEQKEHLDPSLERAADAAEVFITDGIQTAMNRFNERNTPPPDVSEPEGSGRSGPVHPGWMGKDGSDMGSEQ